MTTRHRPDAEITFMLRVLRELAMLPPAGRERVLAYWTARIAEMPAPADGKHGEQQLDIEDVVRVPQTVLRGAAAQMPDLFPITLADMHEECKRELEMRKVVYASRVVNRRLADRRIDIMIAVIALLERLKTEEGENRRDHRDQTLG